YTCGLFQIFNKTSHLLASFILLLHVVKCNIVEHFARHYHKRKLINRRKDEIKHTPMQPTKKESKLKNEEASSSKASGDNGKFKKKEGNSSTSDEEFLPQVVLEQIYKMHYEILSYNESKSESLGSISPQACVKCQIDVLHERPINSEDKESIFSLKMNYRDFIAVWIVKGKAMNTEKKTQENGKNATSTYTLLELGMKPKILNSQSNGDSATLGAAIRE
ncbi:hypothetical protein KI387_030906, partial [Taxus chinensis]